MLNISPRLLEAAMTPSRTSTSMMVILQMLVLSCGKNNSVPGATPDAHFPIASTQLPIAAAVTHACAVVNGAAYCWGENQFGQLGDGTTTNSAIPVQVLGLTEGVQAVAAGWELSCALAHDAAYCWGAIGGDGGLADLTPAKVQGLNSNVQAIIVDINVGSALIDGALYSWGNDLVAATAQVIGLSSNVQAKAAGPCEIVNGAVYCWSNDNQNGQLGNGTFAPSSTPVQAQGLTSGVTAIAGGWEHVCAVMNGDAYCWGNNDHGQLGIQVNLATLCGTPQPASSSTTHSCNSVPVRVDGLPSGVESITAGTYHTCAIAKGLAYCWGYNAYGVLGDGTVTSSYQPVQVQGLTGVTAISASGYPDSDSYDVTCAQANGDIYCWGANAYGQLGNGSTTFSSVPAKVPFPDASADR